MTNGMEMNEALGQSEEFLNFQERLSKVAPVDRAVLLVGERGTGKELAANRLHFLSKRWEKPLVTLNCASISATLIESELFGYEKGAFTGASQQRKGKFEAADGGTLFLDEIGNIPLAVQEKILRVVEYGVFDRVGGKGQVGVDVRIIGATNADLRQMVAEKTFLPDLLDRLSFEVLVLPPLRYRKEDILLLAKHFAARMSYELDCKIPTFSQAVVEALLSYNWPGNIRELKNVIERAVYIMESEVVEELVFDPFVSPYTRLKEEKEETLKHKSIDLQKNENSMELPVEGFKKSVQYFEVELILKALEKAKYNRKKASKMLGLTYDQFRGLLRKFDEHLNI